VGTTPRTFESSRNLLERYKILFETRITFRRETLGQYRKSGAARPTRRGVLALLGALLTVTLTLADAGPDPAAGADGDTLPELFPIPSNLYPSSLPGIVWQGAGSAGLEIYEFFDYNCAYCKKAAREIEEIIAANSDVKLGLINSPILSVGSVQAAKVQQAVLRLYGPPVAAAFHQRMFAKRGQSDGISALAVAHDMALDLAKVEDSADSAVVGGVLRRQAELAASLGVSMTPSFAIAGFGFAGWPGKKAVQTMISNVRRCERPTCDRK
jgi:protein-disulfide isomerase